MDTIDLYEIDFILSLRDINCKLHQNTTHDKGWSI